MKIAIYHNDKKTPSLALAKGIFEFLKERDIDVIAKDCIAQELGATPFSKADITDLAYCVTLGGDGTILNMLNQWEEMNAPIIGVNLGHLGFMADVTISDIYPTLDTILKETPKIETRLMIEGKIDGETPLRGANDIVIHRGGHPSLVEIAIYVGGVYFNTFNADGVIIATPNGSTAYSLAAGGPIINPGVDALVITPISPHTISNRPFVITADEEIEIRNMSDAALLTVQTDGDNGRILEGGKSLKICRSEKQFSLVRLVGRDHFATIRDKLSWTGKLH